MTMDNGCRQRWQRPPAANSFLCVEVGRIDFGWFKSGWFE